MKLSLYLKETSLYIGILIPIIMARFDSFINLVLQLLDSNLFSVLLGASIAAVAPIIVDFRKEKLKRQDKLNEIKRDLAESLFAYFAERVNALRKKLDYSYQKRLSHLIRDTDLMYQHHYEQALMRQRQLDGHETNLIHLKSKIRSKIHELELQINSDSDELINQFTEAINITDESLFDFSQSNDRQHLENDRDRKDVLLNIHIGNELSPAFNNLDKKIISKNYANTSI